MTNKAFNTFHPFTEIVVLGTNPENADYSNPRGEYYGFSIAVQAVNDFGDTRVSPVLGTSNSESEAVAKAERAAAALQTRYDALGKLPVAFDSWAEGRAVYGSDAYVAYGQADDLAWEAQQD